MGNIPLWLYFCLLIPCFLVKGGLSVADIEHRHGAHVHGHAQLNIAVVGSEAEIDFDAPAESIFGFEHAPRTTKENIAVLKFKPEVEKNLAKLVEFPKELQCQFTLKELDTGFPDPSEKKKNKDSSNHRDVEVSYRVKCQSKISGSMIQFGILQLYPGITEIKVQVVSDSKQSGLKIRKSDERLEL